MADLNKAILMGRLTRDPELRHTPSNTPVASFSIAVDRIKGKNGQAETDFLDIVAWSQKAEFVTNYFHKGSKVAVVGRIQTRKWTDNEGKTRVAWEVVADEVHFADSKSESSPTPAARDTGYQTQKNPVVEGFAEVSGDELPDWR